ncbi:bleomycin resistance protein [Burkholderia ubonensis]|uniref:Glyoxalase n=1 Tax=Burkholderia ubonensis TaxID=101571 RepID=A0AAW3MU84_9BURK|nr:VOC family protein [Burkholderia ubonensis]KVL13224.1 glyoxalase [Burkholderia ubonensis]KVO42609.1 glyoxalase [Burkholderia ubonensis]KVP94077.1 glyoxalase [Burkholderia ubonensis]KVQ49529.1 glyoxalase [Burkholderia ubonensis]KVX25297.1 glyoxalase [Burkholderia ubonensis]
MEPKQTSFEKAIPVLASLDIARTLTFFREVLGFRTRHLEDFSYGMAARDDVEIHFWLCDDKHVAENTSCYVRVADIRALHAELAPKLPDLQDVLKTAWGMDELYVIDPDGNLIKFGQSRGEEIPQDSQQP